MLFKPAAALFLALPCAALAADARLEPMSQPEGAATAFVGYITSGLSSPIGIMHAGDGSGRLFVIQQGGQVRVVVNGVLQGTNFLSLSSSTQCRANPVAPLATVGFTSGSERGLLGLAFHPDFESNGQVFVSFTASGGHSYIARFTMADPSANALSATDLDTCTAVIRVNQDFSNHNGGGIDFGPDGYLYFGLGDGGDGGDPCNRGQTINPDLLDNDSFCAVKADFVNSGGNPDSRALLGAMLRLDVDASTPAGANGLCASAGDGSANYAIPADNPYVGADPANACDEIWAWGLRNPWRWSFDRATGDLFIGDVGQGAREEISFEPAASAGGLNFGWNLCEGTSNFAGSCAAVGLTAPIIDYARSGGRCAVTGGYRYRGPVLDAQGRYFFGDYCSGQIWVSDFTGGSWSQPVGGTPFQSPGFGITSFGEDEAGHLYVIASSQVWRLQGAESQPPFVVAPIADQLSDEGEIISLDVAGNFDDPESDELSFSADGLPPGLAISGAGLISGTLGFDTSGGYAVTVNAFDGFSTAADSFLWTVTNINRPPVATGPLPDPSSTEGDTIALDLAPQFSDPDGDALSFSALGLPPGLGIDAGGLVSGELGFNAAGSYSVTLSVDDGEDVLEVSFDWQVDNLNRAPQQDAALADQSSLEQDTIALDLAPAFSDPDDDALEFSALGLPPGLTLAPTGLISGTLPLGSIGDYTVSLTVSDGEDAITVEFAWSVAERPAPIFASGFETLPD